MGRVKRLKPGPPLPMSLGVMPSLKLVAALALAAHLAAAAAVFWPSR